MEDKKLGYMKISKETSNYKDGIIAFWNKNNNDFICEGKVDGDTRETEHLIKKAIALSLHTDLLLNL
jgi:hypothetical protein